MVLMQMCNPQIDNFDWIKMKGQLRLVSKSTPNTGQQNLFHSELSSQLDTKDPLIQLTNDINWAVFDHSFEQHYSKDNGRPSKPIS
jgi:hypothetical protein